MTLTIIRGNGETGLTGPTGGRVQNAIASASASTGVDFKYLYRQAGIESGFNANAQATTSRRSVVIPRRSRRRWSASARSAAGSPARRPGVSLPRR